MKRIIQLLALILVVATVVVWVAKGLNVGWTKDKVQVKTLDPVTEIEQVEWQDKFLPGLDFLGAGMLGAGVLALASRYIRKPKNQ